jgi:hypothetical protein
MENLKKLALILALLTSAFLPALVMGAEGKNGSGSATPATREHVLPSRQDPVLQVRAEAEEAEEIHTEAIFLLGQELIWIPDGAYPSSPTN